MKKILTIVLMAVFTITANAQGNWRVSHRQADELKGQTAQDVYMYEAPGIGSVVVWDWTKPDFRLITDNGFFHQKNIQGVGLCVPINVGFYDKNDNLKTKFQLIMFVEDNQGMKWIATGGWYLAGRGNIRKALSRMKSGDGYVRIVAELYNRPDFDIKISPFDKQKFSVEDKSEVIEKAFRPSTSAEITQIAMNPIQFYDGTEYSTPDDVLNAGNNKKLKSKTLNKGEKFVVLGIEGKDFVLAKVQLANGKLGWVYPAQVPNRLAFLPLFPFRDEFIPNIDTKTVAPGMTKEEVFIITGSYVSPKDKLSKVFEDYISYRNNKTLLSFYKNSLFFASQYKGGFWYKGYNSYKLVNVSRNESIIDDSISPNTSLNYRDDIMFISWNIQRNLVKFTLQNKSTSSIKIIWDDMAFVGLDEKSKRVIHQGIKYNEKENPQSPSVVMRDSRVTDLLIPSSNIYYNQSLKKWSAHPLVYDIMFSPEDETTQHASGKKIKILLPIIVNEKRYEYQFVFEIDNIKYTLINSEYDQRTADILQ